MSEGDRHLRHEGEWIEGAQAHSMCQVLDRNFWIAEIDPHPAAKMPRLGKIWIEQESAIDEGGSNLDILDNICKCKPTPSERYRVIPAQFHRAASEPCCFGSFLQAVYHPTTPFAPDVTPRGHAVGRGKIRVEFSGLVEEP